MIIHFEDNEKIDKIDFYCDGLRILVIQRYAVWFVSRTRNIPEIDGENSPGSIIHYLPLTLTIHLQSHPRLNKKCTFYQTGMFKRIQNIEKNIEKMKILKLLTNFFSIYTLLKYRVRIFCFARRDKSLYKS